MASIERCIVLITLVLLVHCGEYFVNGVITDVGLFGGLMPDRGTVYIRQDNGSWETTCGVNLGINDVIVICRQLGFTGASRAITNTSYGQNSTSTRGLHCNGGEGYLGCFRDLSTDRVFPGDGLVTEPHMTISYCIQFCKVSIAASYVYAGVENGDECFCGKASDNYTRLGVGSDANCQSPCLGDPTESCGGVRYVAVFRVPNRTSTSTARPTLTSTYQSTVRRTSAHSQSPTTPGVESTDSVETERPIPPSSPSPVMITTNNIVHSQSPKNRGMESTDSVETGRPSPSSSPSPVITTANNIGLYAGVAGGVVAIIISVVIIIVVVISMRKRSRRQHKAGLQSHDMTVMKPASPNSTQGHLYHNIFQDNSDETPHGLQLPDPSTDGDVTYYSSVKDHELLGGDDTYYSTVKDQKSTNADSKLNNTMPSDQNDGLSEKGVARPPPNGDVEVMNAMPDNTRKSQGEENIGPLYAKPDTTGNGGDGQGSEDFGALFAMPDKSRVAPEGREDVNGSRVGLKSEGNSGEGLHSLADDDTGLYAMSTAPGHTVSNDNEYGTIMVDNELYAM